MAGLIRYKKTFHDESMVTLGQEFAVGVDNYVGFFLEMLVPDWSGHERLSAHLKHEMAECAVACVICPSKLPEAIAYKGFELAEMRSQFGRFLGALHDLAHYGPGCWDFYNRDPVVWLDRDLSEFRCEDAEQ